MRAMFWLAVLAALVQAGCGKREEPTRPSRFEYLEDAQRKCWRINDGTYRLPPWTCEDKR